MESWQSSYHTVWSKAVSGQILFLASVVYFPKDLQ